MYDDYDAVYHVLLHAPARHLRAYANVSHAFRAAAMRCTVHWALAAASLNKGQLVAIVRAVTFGSNVFLTGGAGVGKTFCSRVIVDMLRTLILLHEGGCDVLLHRLIDTASGGLEPQRATIADMLHRERGRDDGSAAVVVVAPTGTAARMLGGSTLHTQFGIRVCDEVEQQRSVHPEESELAVEDDVFRPRPPSKRAEDRLCAFTTRHSRERKPLLKVLVIDEVSMVRCDLIDTLERDGRFFSRSTRDGDVQIIAIGDWFQLSPVAPDASGEREDEAKVFAFESDGWRLAAFVTAELTQVMRQDTGEARFVEILNRMRLGVLTMQDTRYLSDAVLNLEDEDDDATDATDAPSPVEKKGKAPIALFHRVRARDEHNQKRLEELEAPMLYLEAHDSVHVQCNVAKENLVWTTDPGRSIDLRRIVETHGAYAYDSAHGTHTSPYVKKGYIANGIERHMAVPPRGSQHSIAIKVGCRLMCTRNLFAEDMSTIRVANGSTGTLLDVVWTPVSYRCARNAEDGAGTQPTISALVVRWDAFDDEPAFVMTVERHRFRRRSTMTDRQIGLMYATAAHNKLRIDSNVDDVYEASVVYERLQFPVCVCYAKNIHQSQGSTITTRVDMDLVHVTYSVGHNRFEAPYGLVYTALSRIKSIRQLRFLAQLDQSATRNDRRLRNAHIMPSHVRAHPKALAYYEEHPPRALPEWFTREFGA